MKKLVSMLLVLAMLCTMLPFQTFAVESDKTIGNTGTSLYSWNMYMLSKGSYPDIRDYLTSLNITRVYQQIPEVYLTGTETADMIARLADDGIETVALVGDRAWGLAENDLSEAKTYMNKLAAYNSGIGAKNPITKIAFDVETYTYSFWENDSVSYFAAYIEKMQEVYAYAHSCGLTVIQVIPTHYDTIDAALNRKFFTTCADEISLMNYEKATQVTAIQEEIALCEELGMEVETIFETMPRNEYFGVTEENTYFYEGYSALLAKQETILNTYPYRNLSVSYHHLPTMYHVVTGKYIAEIYAYTDSNDPTKNDLGQTDALKSIILTGSDGSVIEAGLCNPNLTAQYAENCYIAVGVVPGVEYTISSAAEDYAVTTPTKTFSIGEDDVIGYASISIERIASAACKHVEEIRNAKEATCSEKGYTGDIYCSVCNQLLTSGTTIAKTAHTAGETAGNQDGTHSTLCSVCKEVLSTESCTDYNEDGLCDVCGAKISGTVFTPDMFKVTLSKTSVRKGQVVTLTVRTSEDVTSITVNGEKITNYQTTTETYTTGSGRKKVTTTVTCRVFTYTISQNTRGKYTYNVVACNSGMQQSNPQTVVLTVK
ncbi:MAG: hypothetical protein PUF80_02915 [Firmicutes bacterium]|nr:hypothetical protein [Bacillota bacterium]